MADDEPLPRQALVRHLERAGFSARTAESGEQALVIVDETDFDLILLDIEMPGMTGFQALERISLKTKAPVVLMTGHADEDLRKDALLLGARDFLEKPFDFARLDRLLGDIP